MEQCFDYYTLNPGGIKKVQDIPALHFCVPKYEFTEAAG
jgi:hypothetical protein